MITYSENLAAICTHLCEHYANDVISIQKAESTKKDYYIYDRFDGFPGYLDFCIECAEIFTKAEHMVASDHIDWLDWIECFSRSIALSLWKDPQNNPNSSELMNLALQSYKELHVFELKQLN